MSNISKNLIITLGLVLALALQCAGIQTIKQGLHSLSQYQSTNLVYVYKTALTKVALPFTPKDVFVDKNQVDMYYLVAVNNTVFQSNNGTLKQMHPGKLQYVSKIKVDS